MNGKKPMQHKNTPSGNMFIQRGQSGLLALLALLTAVFGHLHAAAAQTTGTNAVTLVADNVTNASNVLTPIVIGVSIIFIVWAFVKKVGKRAG